MKEINIRDSTFAHHPESVTHEKKATMFKWCRENRVVSDSCFITDRHLQEVDKLRAKRKIAMLIEPRAIHPFTYKFVEENNKKFDYILTFDKELLDRGANFLFYPFGVCWIKDFSPVKKSKLCSMIASAKRMTPGHHFRQEVISRFSNRVDHFGTGFKRIEFKEEGLRDYYFSIVMENSRLDYYFSEKIIDCFATKTIPIYWGSNVSPFFDMNGIITFNSMEELEEIYNKLTPEFYNSFKTGMENNFNKVKDYEIPEDWLYKHYPFLFSNLSNV
jgi:hypothetical protein